MSNQPWSIAVVDDDESMCHALARVLRAAGYGVQTYYSAEAYMDDPAHRRTDFLVADIQLRGMSGFDLQERLRAEPPAPPVALITAHDEADVREQARTAGCAVYLRKPFPSGLLLGAIKQALGQEPAEPDNPFPQFRRHDRP